MSEQIIGEHSVTESHWKADIHGWEKNYTPKFPGRIILRTPVIVLNITFRGRL